MTDRSVRQLNDAIATLWRGHEAAVSRNSFSSWTDEDRRHYDLKIVYEGMNYGFNALRLSQAAERILRTDDDLAELADTILARLHNAKDPVTTGYVADTLNTMARERAAV